MTPIAEQGVHSNAQLGATSAVDGTFFFESDYEYARRVDRGHSFSSAGLSDNGSV